MTTRVNAIIADVPQWRHARDIQVEPLSGGLTNQNLRVTVDGQRYVLRIGGDNAASLGIDREREYRALLAASSIGVGPEVVHFSLPEGHLVTRFIEGHQWTEKEFGTQEVIQRVAQTMKRVHALPPIDGSFSPFRHVEARIEVAKRLHLPLPGNLRSLLNRMHTIEAMAHQEGEAQVALCHNDPFHTNFLDEGRVRLLDWEFAGMGDVFYDLASIAFSFSAEQDGWLLTSYFGEVTASHRSKLSQMRFMAWLWNGMWALVQSGLVQDGPDYGRMAQGAFATLLQRMPPA